MYKLLLTFLFRAWEILALLVFLSVGIQRWQKPKVLKYAAGSMKHND
tara:strand:- start:14413 stop:14553 length:141 start_codon:yes stop_codon:yes gene_type:complete